MTSGFLNTILACSICGADLLIQDTDIQAHCSSCGATFGKGNYVWDFIPTNLDWSSPMWQTWQHLQENGLAGYQSDPEHNLAIVEREDTARFSNFCNYHGLVLDIGCGPQPWPAYFDRNRDAVYIGIDPLIEDTPGDYLRFKGLGEFLPFRPRVFDHVLFSTTLDHFIDPVIALKSAARVCRPEGEIDIWLGEKQPGAPKPVVSPEWYTRLQKPDLAEDLFHVKRLNRGEFLQLVQKTGLMVVDVESHPIDDFRVNHFYRLKRKA